MLLFQMQMLSFEVWLESHREILAENDDIFLTFGLGRQVWTFLFIL